MNQAIADPPTQDETEFSPTDQAPAGGVEESGQSAASASRAEANETDAVHPGADALAAGPGLAEESGGESLQDEFNVDDDPLAAIEAYRSQVAAFTGEPDSGTVEADAAPDVSQPREETAEAIDTDPEPIHATQFRLRPRTPLGEKAFALMKADPYLQEEEAFARAREEMGQAPAAESANQATEEAGTETAQTVEAIHRQIRELRRQGIAAKREFDAEAEAEIEEQILDLEDRLPEIEAAERARLQADREAEAAWLRTAEATGKSVAARFPEAADTKSPFAQRMAAIDEAWEEAGDARFYDPRKAQIIAEIVAKELGRNPATAPQGGRVLPAPRSHSTSPSANPGSAPARGLVPALGPASGAARTNTPASQQSQVMRQIEGLTDPEDYLRLKEQLLSGSAA